jgi:hypothetical protein
MMMGTRNIHFSLQGFLGSRIGDYLGYHRCPHGNGGGYAELLNDLGHVLLLLDSESPFLQISLNSIAEQLGGCFEVIDLELFGECSLHVDEEFSNLDMESYTYTA